MTVPQGVSRAPSWPHARHAAIGIGGAVALLACAPPPAPAAVDCGARAPADAAATLELRSGPRNETLFRTLADGDTVALTAGPQGGQHIWLEVRSRDVCPNQPRVQIRVLRASDGAVIGGVTGMARWVEVPGAGGLYASNTFTAFVDDGAFCPLLAGGMVRVQARVEDAAGAIVERELTLRVQGWSSDSNTSLVEGRENCCANFLNTRCWPNGPPDGG